MHTTDAIVLSTRLLGERDELVSFYTRRFGKLQVRARGTKNVSSKQGAFLHEPAICQCSFIMTRAGHLLSGIKSIRAYPSISQNLYAFGYLLSFFQLCDDMLFPEQRDEAMWQLLRLTLEDAESAKAIPEAERSNYLWRKEKVWLLTLLDVLGVKPASLSLDQLDIDQRFDLELKRIFEHRFERPVSFFGLRTVSHRTPHA